MFQRICKSSATDLTATDEITLSKSPEADGLVLLLQLPPLDETLRNEVSPA